MRGEGMHTHSNKTKTGMQVNNLDAQFQVCAISSFNGLIIGVSELTVFGTP